MTALEISVVIASAALGGGGLVGLAFFLLRRYIEKKLAASEAEAKKRRDSRIERTKIEDELLHAYGRLHFWEYRAIVTNSHNGELDAAFRELQAAEAKKKDMDRAIIAESEQE